MTSKLQLIVGLGNPGPQYEATRHNAGADFVFLLAHLKHAQFKPDKKFQGLYTRLKVDGTELHCLVPTTFMNRSGQSVSAICSYYKIPPEAILVAHDELDIQPGTARLKQGGGHGGHNGLRDIVAHLGTNDFMRLRIGIGHPGHSREVVDYVLKKASKPDQALIDDAIRQAIAILPEAVHGQWNKAQTLMNGFNAATVNNSNDLK